MGTDENGVQVQVDIIYDPGIHKIKLDNITQLADRLHTMRTIRGTNVINLMSIYPVLKEAEELMEYFETISESGKHFGVVLSKYHQNELKRLSETIDQIRAAASREFRWNSTRR